MYCFSRKISFFSFLLIVFKIENKFYVSENLKSDPDAMMTMTFSSDVKSIYLWHLHAEHYHLPYLLLLQCCCIFNRIWKSVSVDPYLSWGRKQDIRLFWGLQYLVLSVSHLHMPGNKNCFCGQKKFSWMIPESLWHRKKVFRIIQRLHAFINIFKLIIN